MNQWRTAEDAAVCSSQSASETRELPGSSMGGFISLVAGHQCAFARVGGVLTPPPKRAHTSDPVRATKVAHKFPRGGLSMTRLGARVDNPAKRRAVFRATVGGEEVRVYRLH